MHIMQNQMKVALIASSLLHVGLFLFAVYGLPFIGLKKSEPITPIQTFDIEFIIDDKTQSPEPKEALKKPPPPKQDKPKPAPKMTAEAPPDLSKVPPPPEPEKQIAEAEPDLVPLPEADSKPKTIAKPLPQKPKITKRAKPPENNEQFTSLLKNLLEPEEAPSPSLDDVLDTAKNNAPKNVPLAQRMTLSEIDAVKRQLASCWSVLSGARYAENLNVQVKLFMNPDRSVRRAMILDEARYNRDAIFKAAADSALRALRQPACETLLLPADKFEQWKVTIINFDPSEML